MAQRRYALINKPSSATEVNDLTSAVTWANVPDANITQSSVTQHEAALTLTEAQVEAALSAATAFAANNYVFNVDQTVGAGQDNYVLTYDNGSGEIGLEAAAGGGLGNVVEDTTPQLGGILDTNSFSIDFADNIEARFGTGADVTLDFDATDFNITGVTATDINITGFTAIAAGTVDADFDAITATSYGGITEANLLDKAATETVSGAYTFTGGITVTTGNIVAGTIDADFDALTATSYGGITEGNLVDKAANEVVSGEWSVPSIIRGKTTNYTMVLGDAGQTVRMTGSTAAQTITIPANSSVAYPVGTLICIENDATVSWSLAITTDTLTWSKDNTTGTRTLAAGASCVIHKVTTTAWKVNGSALVT